MYKHVLTLDASNFRPQMILTILRQGDRLHDTIGASGQTGGRGQTGTERRDEQRRPEVVSQSQSDPTPTTS